uniref:Transmembrane protein n=1 Tax=Marseillevirus LCMAC102 TaxID=2506603 RepID=A0A481YTN2_9VIRU|nr:MAG: hypothetical protein LCMAC102_01750 [Marseillevirus LCMAC102]
MNNTNWGFVAIIIVVAIVLFYVFKAKKQSYPPPKEHVSRLKAYHFGFPKRGAYTGGAYTGGGGPLRYAPYGHNRPYGTYWGGYAPLSTGPYGGYRLPRRRYGYR